jgi:hypothetical protein
MDTGGIAKALAAAATAPPRLDALQPGPGVASDLPLEAAVQQPGGSEAVIPDARRAMAGAALDAVLSEFIRRHVEIDPKTRDVVFETVDEKTGRVIRQLPDEAMLKLRAYVRELRVAEDARGESAGTIEKIA